MSLVPLAQTPMSEEAGRKMQSYARQVQRDIENIAPWLVKEQRDRRMRRTNVKPGEIAVVLGDGESMNDPAIKELFGNTPVVEKEE